MLRRSLKRIRREIEEHIRTEEEMISRLREVLSGEVRDKAVKFLLESVLRDELYHHALLQKVYEMIIKRETFSESDLWDAVWQEAMFHGTPGG